MYWWWWLCLGSVYALFNIFTLSCTSADAVFVALQDSWCLLESVYIPLLITGAELEQCRHVNFGMRLWISLKGIRCGRLDLTTILASLLCTKQSFVLAWLYHKYSGKSLFYFLFKVSPAAENLPSMHNTSTFNDNPTLKLLPRYLTPDTCSSSRLSRCIFNRFIVTGVNMETEFSAY